MEKSWKIKFVDEQKLAVLAEGLKINPLLCRILVARGVESFEQAKTYFRPETSSLHDPWLMKGMDKAVARILEAVTRQEKILIYGDYDVDGTTGVACLFLILSRICLPGLLDFYIPHRHREGYGVSRAGIDHAKKNGFELVVSVDCGIKSTDLVADAAAAGIDFIICDHHLPDSQLPAAVAILNPKQPDCGYPYKDLCGCGVAFKLITALALTLGWPESDYFFLLDLVAIAIAADIVPMTGENRLLAFRGLQKVNEEPNHGIRALMKLSGLNNPVSITSLVFMVAPRVNAAGRMDDARKAVQMFVADGYEAAFLLAEQLHSDNTDRKEADSLITEEALALIESSEWMKASRSTVVFSSHWHKGVVGIVASRLIETYYRPTVVLTRSGELVSGSARSVQGFNLYEAIHGCREFLIGYGGHFAAAGMTMAPEHVDQFRLKFEEIVSATIEPGSLIPELIIDAEIQLSDISSSFYNILRQMEPYGPENPNPVFISRNVQDSGYSRLLKDKHIRFSLSQNNSVIPGIGFNMAGKFHLLANPVDIVYSLDEQEWKGVKSLQMKVIDLKISEPGEKVNGR